MTPTRIAQPKSQQAPRPEGVPMALLQRKCACGASPGAESECAGCRKKKLQKKAEAGGQTPDVPPIVHDVLRSTGQPLDEGTRALLEPRFGHDFSRVRVHTDSRAFESAQAVGALAYTVGSHVAFGEGRYEPGSTAGRRLLAHELAHVVQQESSQLAAPAGEGLAVSPANHPLEARADAAVESVIQGGHFDPGQSGRLQLQRQTAGNDIGPSQQVQAAGNEAPPPGDRAPSRIKSVKVWMNAFIPDDLAGERKVPDGPYKGHTMIVAPYWHRCFLTDDRSFSNDSGASARIHSEFIANFQQWPHLTYATANKTGVTNEVDCETGRVECTKQASKYGLQVFPPIVFESRAIFPIEGAASDPCVDIAPDIDYGGFVQIDVGSGEVAFEGSVEPFPAFEMYAAADDGEGEQVFELSPEPGSSPLDLYGSANRKVSGSAKL